MRIVFSTSPDLEWLPGFIIAGYNKKQHWVGVYWLWFNIEWGEYA
jgi:hypothetical protein